MRPHRIAVLVVGVASLACAAAPPEAEPPAPAPAPTKTLELPAIEPSDAGRPDDCPLEADGLEQVLEPEQEGAKVALDRRGHMVESFTWPDGTPARVTQGGCAHYHYVESFGLAEVPADPYAKVLELSNRLKRIPNDDLTVKGMLENAGKLGEDGSFPCGDATCAVTVDTEGPNPVLSLEYDFPI